MVDTRFYHRLGPLTLRELGEAVGAELGSGVDDSAAILDVAPVDVAGPDDLTFLQDAKHASDASAVEAGACLARAADAARLSEAGVATLTVDRPAAAFATAARMLVKPRPLTVDDQRISADAEIADSAVMGPGVVIGPGAKIGPHVVIEPNAVIGAGVELGASTRVGAGAVVSFAIIGADCALLAGAVVGDMGFGLAVDAHGPVDAPHFGRVLIGDRVTIGANSAVDRGRFRDTIINDDVKIDNLVQIAHNVQIGARSVLAGCCGIAGSVVIGANAQLGGSVGVADHVTIGDGAQIAAASVLMRDVPAGQTWAGMPAKPIQSYFREVATLARLAKTKTRPDSVRPS